MMNTKISRKIIKKNKIKGSNKKNTKKNTKNDASEVGKNNPKKQKNKYFNGLILAFFLGIFSFVLISFLFDYQKILDSFLKFPVDYVFYAIAIVFITWIFESITLKLSLSGISQISFYKCYKTSIITQFFNLLTPFYTGGQPFAIYYLSKNGVNYEYSIASIVLKSVIFQAVITVSGITSLIILSGNLGVGLKFSSILGIVVNGSIIVFSFLIILNKYLIKYVVYKLLNFLEKIKILKTEKKSSISKSVETTIERLFITFTDYRKKPMMIFCIFFIYLIQYFFYILAGAIILVGYDLKFDISLIARLYLMNISSAIVPTPGTSGGAETLFVLFFKNLASSEDIGAATIIWRLCTYYFSVIFSGIFSFLVYYRKNKYVR